jgi:hypothetical protein
MKLADFKLWLDGYLAGTDLSDKARATLLAKLATVQPEQLHTGGAIAGWPPGVLPRAPGQVSGGTMPLNDGRFFLGGAMLCDAHITPGVLRADQIVTGGITANKISVGTLSGARIEPGSLTARAINALHGRSGA